MANYTEVEESLIIKLYREYRQCKQNTFKLQPEDKQVLMKHITNLKDFNSYENRGYLFYKRFALPYCLPQQSTVARRRIGLGEGLSVIDREILHEIEVKLQTEALVDIWEGDIPDVCIVFASIIEAGFGAKLLPKVLNRGIQMETTVAQNAKILLDKRRKDKIKAAKQKIKDQIYGGLGKNN